MEQRRLRQTQVAAEQKSRTEAEAELAKAKEKVASLETEIAKANEEKTKLARVADWVNHTGVTHEVASKAVASLMKLSDDEFKNFLDTQPKASKANETPKEPVKPEDLDNVEKEEAPPTPDTKETDTQETSAKIQSSIASILKSKRNQKGGK